MKTHEDQGLEARIEELKEPKTFAAAGGLVGLVLGVIYSIIAGFDRGAVLATLLMPFFCAALAGLGMQGYQKYPQASKWLAGGAVLGLLMGALLPGIWPLYVGLLLVIAPLGLYRGYAELRAAKYCADEHRNRVLPMTSGIYLLTICASLACWLSVVAPGWDLLWSLLVVPFGLLTYFFAASVYEGQMTNEDLVRFEKRLAKLAVKEKRYPSRPPLY